jgi:ribonuclease HI
MRVLTDGACDDSIAGIGWCVFTEDENVKGKRYLVGDYTSMESEYYALLDGLRYARRESRESVTIRCDCKPLVEKMRVPDGNSEDWYKRRQGFHRLANKFDNWELEWMPRSSNDEADRLAYEALEQGRDEIQS